MPDTLPQQSNFRSRKKRQHEQLPQIITKTNVMSITISTPANIGNVLISLHYKLNSAI